MNEKPKTKKPEIPKEEMQRFLLAKRKMIQDMNAKLDRSNKDE